MYTACTCLYVPGFIGYRSQDIRKTYKRNLLKSLIHVSVKKMTLEDGTEGCFLLLLLLWLLPLFLSSQNIVMKVKGLLHSKSCVWLFEGERYRSFLDFRKCWLPEPRRRVLDLCSTSLKIKWLDWELHLFRSRRDDPYHYRGIVSS